MSLLILLVENKTSLLDHVLINSWSGKQNHLYLIMSLLILENKTSLLDHEWKTKHLYLIMSLLILLVENKTSLLDHVLINSLE